MGAEEAKKAKRAWDSLDPSLSPWVLEAMASMSFARPTPVQATTIPLAMGYKDVVVEAVTGSGKTLSFLIPVVERILRLEEPPKKHHVAAIVISPTRELASQIFGVLTGLLEFHTPSRAKLHPDEDLEMPDSSDLVSGNSSATQPAVVPQLLVGGDVSTKDDMRNFIQDSPNLLVATPGRLLELLESPRVHCPQSSFDILIMDEADRLLDLGFKDTLQRIIQKLPKQRRTGLFSASMSEAVDQLVNVGLRNPLRVSVKVKGATGQQDQRTPSSLAMTYVVTKASERLPVLAKILASLQPTPTKSIIYMSTCAAVDYFQYILPSLLNAPGGSVFHVVPLHGKHPPKVRQKNFVKFSNATSPTVLLTTDVAARGLDISQVDLVMQIDPPSDPKVFLHRCGRAGRAGRKGLSIVFLQAGREEDYVPYLEIRKTPIKPFEDIAWMVTTEESKESTGTIRDLALQDRAIHEKAQKAFVSWLQSYSKHHASSIFRVTDLDWEDLGQAWGLLKLPKMPELKRWEGDKKLGLDIDWDSYGFKDKQREAARIKSSQEAADKEATEGVADHSSGPKRKKAWTIKQDIREERDKRRDKRQVKREKQRLADMTSEEKEQQKNLEGLIRKVRETKEKEDKLEEFEGFGD